MLTFKLPAFSLEQPPRISDLKACKLWLSGLQLNNVQTRHNEISYQLQQLNQYRISPRERLKIIEQLRETVVTAQADMARKYAGKPVPFGAMEQMAWDNVCKLWCSLELAYQYCLQGCLEGDAGVVEHVALITQRCMRCIGLLMLEHYRAYRQVNEKLWQQLHSLYAYAESRGHADMPVKDSLNVFGEPSSCAAVYVQATLVNLANPYQFSTKQINILDRWLDKWGGRVEVSASRFNYADQAEIVVDLSGAANDSATESNNLRYLDSKRLSDGLRKRIKFLRKGGMAIDLDIGIGCSETGCEKFLTLVYKQWCEIPMARICERRLSNSVAELSLGMVSMHFFINGKKAFERDIQHANLDWKAVQELQMFGRISEKSIDQRAEELGFALETWKMQDESALGFCLMRQVCGADRISHNQVLALKPKDSRKFVLGVVCWQILTIEGGTLIGVRVLPGVPEAIEIKLDGLNQSDRNKLAPAPALMLCEVGALHTEPSLILPLGWFEAGRRLGVYAPGVKRVKMNALLEKGSDYERVSFTAE